MEKPKSLANEFWGGLAAMLVALPSAIAFGVSARQGPAAVLYSAERFRMSWGLASPTTK